MDPVPPAGHEFGPLADLLKEALLLISEDARVVEANAAAVRLLRRNGAELAGAHLSSLTPATPQELDALRRRVFSNRSFVPGSLVLRLAGGETLSCRCDGALYRSRTADAPALAVLRLVPRQEASSEFLALRDRISDLTREVTARRAVEEALRESSERYRVTLESIGDAVIATDAQGRVEFMNFVAQQLTGWTEADSLGRHLDEVFVILNEETREKVESPVAKVLRAGGIVGLANHTLLVRRDGSELPIDDSGAPIRDARKRMRGVVLVFRDLSERHKLERELLAKTASLQEADRRKDEFLSILAHELRNPLAPIRTGIEVLKRRSDPGTVRGMTELMARQIEHMVRLIDDLLDVSRLTRGKFELRVAPLRLEEVLRAAQEMVQPVYDASGVHLEVVPPPADATLMGDFTRLVQVLTNLLSNAVKFSERGKSVTVATEVTGAAVVVSVVDAGAGIDPDRLERVFDLFYQEHQGQDRDRGGLGVGLTISRSIVEMHGGTLHAQSEGRGLGSTFRVQLPLSGNQEESRVG